MPDPGTELEWKQQARWTWEQGSDSARIERTEDGRFYWWVWVLGAGSPTSGPKAAPAATLEEAKSAAAAAVAELRAAAGPRVR